MKFDVKKYAHLARIKLTPKESEKIGEDLQDVLKHFEELGDLNTDKVEPMTGGMALTNIFREDKEEKGGLNGGTEQFPNKKDGYLKGPQIMER